MRYALSLECWCILSGGAVVGGMEFHFVAYENAASHSTPNKNYNSELKYLYFISLCRQMYDMLDIGR